MLDKEFAIVCFFVSETVAVNQRICLDEEWTSLNAWSLVDLLGEWNAESVGQLRRRPSGKALASARTIPRSQGPKQETELRSQKQEGLERSERGERKRKDMEQRGKRRIGCERGGKEERNQNGRFLGLACI